MIKRRDPTINQMLGTGNIFLSGGGIIGDTSVT